jgi:hypothetical protein
MSDGPVLQIPVLKPGDEITIRNTGKRDITLSSPVHVDPFTVAREQIRDCHQAWQGYRYQGRAIVDADSDLRAALHHLNEAEATLRSYELLPPD